MAMLDILDYIYTIIIRPKNLVETCFIASSRVKILFATATHEK